MKKITEIETKKDNKLSQTKEKINQKIEKPKIFDKNVINEKKEQLEQLKDKIVLNAKEEIENTKKQVIEKRYIFYFFDRETKNAILYPDYELKENWRNKDTNELFSLGKPAFYFEGLPVYFIIRDFNFSIELDFRNENQKLVERDYRPIDMDAKLNSQVLNRLLRLVRKMDKTTWIAILLFGVVVSMTTLLCCLPFILSK